MFDYREAKQIVKQEIDRLYRQWGPAVNREREDLMQIGFVTLLEVDRMGAFGAVAVRRDFSDRMRSQSGIRRKDSYRYILGKDSAHGYVPLEPIRGTKDLSEVELAVDCERQLESRNSKRPTEMVIVQSLASGDTVAEIANRLQITRTTVFTHCHHFRRALTSGGT